MARALAFVGFGEAGSLFAAGLAGAGLRDMLAYDVAVHGGPGEPLLRRRASESGVALAGAPEELAGAETVFVMVQPGVAERAVAALVPHLPAGTLCVDLCSSSPAVKQACARRAADRGLRYVDAAIIGSVPASRHRVAILAAGDEVPAFLARFAPLGMQITRVEGGIGAAAGIKLVRSVLAKGLEAVYVEALVAAHRLGLAGPVLETFCAFLDERPAADTAALLVRSHVVHAARRADEVRMSRALILEAGLDPVMTDAITRILEQSAAAGTAEAAGGAQPPTLEAALQVLDRCLPPPTPQPAGE